MKNVLDILGNIPVSSATVASLFPDVSGGNQKVASLEHEGKLIRLKRGLYIMNPTWSGRRISINLVANHLYSPSYVSMHSALRWYGLIPERVVSVQSVSLKHTRRFETPLGLFLYTQVDRDYFPIGLRHEQTEDASFVIAGPEKALCDLVCTTAGLNLRYLNETRAFLEEDLRLDMDAFRDFDPDILQQCADAGKKARTIETIIKLLRR